MCSSAQLEWSKKMTIFGMAALTDQNLDFFVAELWDGSAFFVLWIAKVSSSKNELHSLGISAEIGNKSSHSAQIESNKINSAWVYETLAEHLLFSASYCISTHAQYVNRTRIIKLKFFSFAVCVFRLCRSVFFLIINMKMNKQTVQHTSIEDAMLLCCASNVSDITST